uniref:EF-hand domain-containing protein n=1 Tax=Anopheles quadriannulatus TaxID=34691 RepID=A0A182XLL8_ANOQN
MVTHLRNITSRDWESGCENQDCPNGKLTPAKFVDMYKMFFPSGNAEEFCDHVFRTFDMDKNGYIDFKRLPFEKWRQVIGIGCHFVFDLVTGTLVRVE